MSIIMAVYSKKAFKEFILPPINNSDYSIFLEKEDFHIREDITLSLEVLDEAWRIKRDLRYRILRGKSDYDGSFLRDKDMLTLENKYNERVFLIIKEKESIFHACNKYDIRDRNQIVIGKHLESDIVYDYMNLVSKKHALIIKKEGNVWIEDHSTNGTYVNSIRVSGRMNLYFGDYINIMGLHLIYLGDQLAVDEQVGITVVKLKKLFTDTAEQTQTMIMPKRRSLSSGKTIYHRFPRNYERLNEAPVEIEEPPEQHQEKEESLMMSVGPSVTMALPMLLGCMMMIYASSADGRGSSLYMYSGLVMALSSALVGVIWSVLNIRQQKKEKEKKDRERFEAYSKYLIEKTDYIKQEYENSEKMLQKKYPSTRECLAYDEVNGNLWNRNRSHEDFLTHRIGIGDIPFQMNIDIPKKRFRIYEDELTRKPEFIKENYQTLYKVPVTVDFTDHSLIGVIGGNKKRGALQVAQVITAQLAANTCYTDVKLAVIYNGQSSVERELWEYAKWLPHTWSEDHKTRYVASDKKEAGEVFYELSQIFRTRAEEERKKEELPKPYYIVILSDPSLMTGEIFTRYAFDKDNSYGLTTFLLVERYEDLPNSCEFIIQNDDQYKGMYTVSDREDQRVPVEFDQIDQDRLETFARGLAKLKVTELEAGGDIPSSLTFFEMFGVKGPEELPVKDLWTKNRVYENIRGVIGWKAGGSPCYLDVHEKYHGPHGLVAGTTGSGKSETLQTYILSLAVNYSPDDIGFFIIDYKGGGMANLFDGLPHMIGQISNLSGNQVRRAMISIKSENRRRQRVFTENGVNNINAYTRLYKNKEATLPVPHMFIIIDEFAELKREEPEFMKELISVAQVGRSLGVHLILATQKPSGTVDDNIWSNSKFRLCLRVQDRQDSNDMLHKPDAAYITQAGRCYLQVGNDEIYELFQSGYSGAAYDENAKNERSDIAKLLLLNGKVELTGNMAKATRKKKAQYSWLDTLVGVIRQALVEIGYRPDEMQVDEEQTVSHSSLGRRDDSIPMDDLVETVYRIMEEQGIEYGVNNYNTERLRDFISLYLQVGTMEVTDVPTTILKLSGQNNIKLPETKEKSQLEAVKEHLAHVASENGYDHQLKLWMPVLPDKIYLEEFQEYREPCFDGSWKEAPAKDWSLEIVLGKFDDPENQRQMPLKVDFATDGHLAVCGNIVSGKSTLLQTMIYALIRKYSPEAVNIYAIDFSSKMAAAFEAAPQMGGVMLENDLEKISKFFNMMGSILEERKNLLKGGNYSQYVRVNGLIIPAIILVVDNYAAFKEKTEEAYEETMIHLSREGVNHGIYLVVSGAGFGMNDISNRVGENLNTTLCLALQDKFAYGDLLHNMQIEVLPEAGIKGRGLAYYGKRILEYQTALAVPAENDYHRMELIEKECQRMADSWTGKTARKIPEIPEKPVWSLFTQNDAFEKISASPEYLPIGYDGANADIYGIPLRQTYCWLIWGAKRTGKTNLMRVCIQAALQKDSQIILIDSPGKDYEIYKNAMNVTYAFDEQSTYDAMVGLLPEFKRRNQLKVSLLSQELDEDEIFDRMAEEKPYFIFIADLSWFVPLIYEAELDMRGFLENITEKGQLHNIYFISEMSLEKRDLVAGYPIYENIAGYQTGIHLGGKVSDNPVMTFEYLSFMEQSKAMKNGIGQLPDSALDNGTREVVIPLARR